ncbi:MAG: hypothetical protein WA957_03180 [Alteraurantiacibacter sp.]
MIAFFSAIGVVGWFGISGFNTGTDNTRGEPMIVFAGGSPINVPDDGAGDPATEPAVSEDAYIVGDFGDPVAELYADDDDGGWGESALNSASGSDWGAS